jgi:hypothetical protein
MKKPLSIRRHANVLFLTTYRYQKIKPVFSIRTIIHEFFQEKFNPI